MRRVCFFHAGCPDGFGAAWAVRQAWGSEASYIPRGHEDRLAPGDLLGAEVAFVDIVPSNPELAVLADEASKLHVVDHHITAKERIEADSELVAVLRRSEHEVRLDMSHSGAILAWQHFMPDQRPPDLLLYIEDQDLWRFKLDRSREVNAALSSYPFRFDIWDRLATADCSRLAGEGQAVVRSQLLDIERALETSHSIRLGDRLVEAVNAPSLRAWIGHELATRAFHGQPCGVVYELRSDRVEASIYSIGDFDVAALATARGGGGHRNAAGFSVSLSDWRRDYLCNDT